MVKQRLLEIPLKTRISYWHQTVLQLYRYLCLDQIWPFLGQIWACCGVALTLRLGTVGTLAHLSLGWLCRIAYVFAALTLYKKLFFTMIYLFFSNFGTFDTLARFGQKVACTFDTLVQVVIFTFFEAEIADFLDRKLTRFSAINSLRRGGFSGDSSFGRRCVIRKGLFYFRVSHLLYLHVLSILDFRESRKIADKLLYKYWIWFVCRFGSNLLILYHWI